MTDPTLDDEKPLDPAATRLVNRVRWLMAIGTLTTFIGVAAVLGVIGYRIFRSEGSQVDVMALLPKGARIVSTAVAEDRIAVTIDVGGATEIRTFDAKTLRPAGRLRFTTEP